ERGIRPRCAGLQSRRLTNSNATRKQPRSLMPQHLYDIFFAPFVEFEFMRRALVGALALALAGAPLGVFLILRRMSLTGDAMAHAILPGAAIGYLAGGL